MSLDSESGEKEDECQSSRLGSLRWGEHTFSYLSLTEVGMA